MKELEGTTLWIYQNQKAHRNSYTSVSVVSVYPITYHIPFSCSLLLDTSITLLILYSSIITRCICTRFAVDLFHSFTIAPGRSLPDSSLHIFRLVRCENFEELVMGGRNSSLNHSQRLISLCSSCSLPSSIFSCHCFLSLSLSWLSLPL